MDTLDRSIYQEALIVKSVDHSCVMYSEFEKPMVLKKKQSFRNVKIFIVLEIEEIIWRENCRGEARF